MKKFLSYASLALMLSSTVISCKKSSLDEVSENGLTQAERGLVAAAGFDADWAEKNADGNFLIEGDMLLSKNQLQEMSGVAPTHELIVAGEEHYRTTNLVTLPATGQRIITISLGSGFPTYYSAALDAALARYNNLNLRIAFQRVSSGGNIVITGAALGTSGGGCILGQAGGFPTGGNPSPGFTLSTSSCATTYLNTQAKADEVMAHEIGHCIGFRHTDYMNRYSCGSRKSNEGTAGVGAINIPGTPTTVTGSYNSWMMACTNGDPTVTATDAVALNYVY